MVHYIGVFVPLESGGWRVLFPDVPGCEIVAPNLDGFALKRPGQPCRRIEWRRRGGSTAATGPDSDQIRHAMGCRARGQVAKHRHHDDPREHLAFPAILRKVHVEAI